jgi:hypothetical protein
MTRIEAIPAAAEVHVVPGVVLPQPVVGGIVDAPETQGRPEMAALGGVVVHHVDDHLDPGRVQRFHHRLEFGYLATVAASGRIAVVRGEIADGVIAKIVRQTLADQAVLVHELMDWHQLDRGDAEALQVADDGWVGQPRIGAAQLGRYLRMAPRQAADVGLVDDRVGVSDLRGPVVSPVEEGAGHHRSHRVRRAIRCAGPQCGETELVSKHGIVIADRTVDRLGVGIQEQLVRVADLALDRIPRSMDPVAVVLPRGNTGQITMPDEPVHLTQANPALGSVVVEQAQVHCVGDLREEGKIRAPSIPGSAERIRCPRPDSHRPSRPELRLSSAWHATPHLNQTRNRAARNRSRAYQLPDLADQPPFRAGRYYRQ